MVNTSAIGVMLVAFVTLVTANEDFVNCREPGHHLEQCAFGSICAWDKCHCGEGKRACNLVCQNDMGRWCYGLAEGDRCIASVPQWECMKFGKMLRCMQNPLGPVCFYEGNGYDVGIFTDSVSGEPCVCNDDGSVDCSAK